MCIKICLIEKNSLQTQCLIYCKVYCHGSYDFNDYYFCIVHISRMGTKTLHDVRYWCMAEEQFGKKLRTKNFLRCKRWFETILGSFKREKIGLNERFGFFIAKRVDIRKVNMFCHKIFSYTNCKASFSPDLHKCTKISVDYSWKKCSQDHRHTEKFDHKTRGESGIAWFFPKFLTNIISRLTYIFNISFYENDLC